MGPCILYAAPLSLYSGKEIVQDTVDIIDHFETTVASERSAYPGTATQRVVAHLLDMFGGEGLLRPAMHYRWNFDEVNMPFISDELATALAPGGDRDVREQVFAWASGALREAAVFAYDVAKRFLGMATFEWRGQEMSVGVVPYRMLMLQRLQDAFAACSEHERHAVRGLFRSVGLEPLLDARPRRRVARAGNREVWGALQEASLSV